MWIPPIGEALKNWFNKFGTVGGGSPEEAILDDFSDLDKRLSAYDERLIARLAEQREIEARLERLEIQSRREA